MSLSPFVQHRLKESWGEFKRSAPGQRFQDRYRRRRANPSARAWWRTLMVWGGGLVLLVIGIFLLAFPGPGIPFLFIGGGVLASESLPLARFLDWSEVKIRRMLAGAKHLWQRMPIAVRVATVLVVLTLTGGIAFAGFRVFLGRASV